MLVKCRLECIGGCMRYRKRWTWSEINSESWNLAVASSYRFRSSSPLLCWDSSASAVGWRDVGQFQSGELCCFISPVSCLSNEAVCSVMVTILVSLSRAVWFCTAEPWQSELACSSPSAAWLHSTCLAEQEGDVVVLTWDLISVRSSHKSLNPKANLPN